MKFLLTRLKPTWTKINGCAKIIAKMGVNKKLIFKKIAYSLLVTFCSLSWIFYSLSLRI